MPNIPSISRLATDDADGVLASRGFSDVLLADGLVMPTTDFVDAFMTAVAPCASSAERERLPRLEVERILTQWVARGQRRWPAITLSSSGFVGFVASKARERGPSIDGVLTACRSLLIEDLYLTYGCLQGDDAAMTILERQYFAKLPAFLVRDGYPRDVVQDALARLREQMLLGTSKTGGKTGALLATYGGRGELWSWLRICAVRLLIKEQRRNAREIGLEHDLLEVMDASVARSPELDPLRRQFATRFQELFRASFEQVEAEAKLLLLQHYVDGLTTKQIGLFLGLHRVTVSRRLVAARQELLSHLRSAIMQAFALRPSECDSMIRAFRSQIEISLVSMRAKEL